MNNQTLLNQPSTFRNGDSQKPVRVATNRAGLDLPPETSSEQIASVTSKRPASVSSDQAARIAQIQARRAKTSPAKPPSVSEKAKPAEASRSKLSVKKRRKHPARGARAIALLASISATGGISAAMYYADLVANAAAAEEALAATGVSGIAPLIVADPTVNRVNGTGSGDGTATNNSPDLTSATATEGSTGTFLGTAEVTEWGDVQVKVTLNNDQITAVEAVQIPRGDSESREISAKAEPRLNAQAITIQAANVDVVSGATYTSRAYAKSLQAALDEAAKDQTSQPA